jgi:plasmid stabilization system protein ParE
MPGFALTNKAIADLKEIGYYTQSRWSYEQRNMYLTMLDACFNQLLSSPSVSIGDPLQLNQSLDSRSESLRE